MIRTPSHKWFVSHKKQLVTLRVCLPKVPLHLVDLQVEPTHVSLNTFRFSRKYQLFVKLPEGYDLDPNRAYAVPTDKNYILINVPFSETKEPQSVEGNLLQSTAPTGIAEEATAEGNLDEKKQNRKMREESKEIPKEKPRQLLKKDKENIPFLMERMSSFRSLYVAFQRRLERDIPSIWKRKRILISVRGYFFKYLRGDLSLSELKQLVYRYCVTCICKSIS